MCGICLAALALEDFFLDDVGGGLPILFLWVARPTVVIGRNQNPWLECDVAFNQKQDVYFARRVTGGGAVYHDAGNLNISLILFSR